MNVKKTAPGNSASGKIISDLNRQMNYQKLYSRETIDTVAAVSSTPSLPIMEELDEPPTEEELHKNVLLTVKCHNSKNKE